MTDVRYLKASRMKSDSTRAAGRSARDRSGAAAGAAAADLGRVCVFGDLERVAAAARSGGVRVVDLEAGLLDRLEVVDPRSAQIGRAERIDHDRHALALEHLVALLGAPVEAEPVLEAGAAAALDR